MSVYRCYSQKKPGFDVEAQGLCKAPVSYTHLTLPTMSCV